MIIEFSTKKPTLLVAETEEVGALHQVLRSQTSRCVVLDLAVCVVNRALVALVVFVGIDDAPGETKAILPHSCIFVVIFVIILISGKPEQICHVVGLDYIFVAVDDLMMVQFCLFVCAVDVVANINFTRSTRATLPRNWN